MSDPADPERGGHTAQDPHDGSEYEALFREPVVHVPPAPRRPWWHWPWGGERPAEARSRQDAASRIGDPSREVKLELVRPDPIPEPRNGPAAHAVEEARPVHATPVDATPVEITPRPTQRKRGKTKRASASETVAAPIKEPTPAPAPLEDPTPGHAPTPIKDPRPIPAPVPIKEPDTIPPPAPVQEPEPIEPPSPIKDPRPIPAPAPVEEPVPIPPPAPIKDPVPLSLSEQVVEPASKLEGVAVSEPAPATEPFAAPETPPAPEPEPEPRVLPELREEELPSGRPGPYFDPATEIPVYTDEEIEAQFGPPPRRGRLVATALLVVAAIAAFSTGMFVFNNLIMPRFIHSTAEVKVPDLANRNYDQAEIALKPLGLMLARAGERFDPAVPRGFILSQDPPPETPVRGRKRVMVVVSLGEEFSSVPSLFGESLRSARSLLQRSGLRVTGITRAPSDEVGEGLIAGTDPPSETVLPRNAAVALLVSAGSGQEEYVMPDLVGREISGVRRHLESLGFRVITPPSAPSVGAIVFQDPAAGSRITLDTPISLQTTGRIIR